MSANSWRIRKGDTVIVTTGKDKDKTGQIIAVERKERRVTVQGVNVAVRHQAPRGASAGGRISKEMSIHASNVQIVDPTTGKATRIGVKFLDDGRKVRYAKSSGTIID